MKPFLPVFFMGAATCSCSNSGFQGKSAEGKAPAPRLPTAPATQAEVPVTESPAPEPTAPAPSPTPPNLQGAFPSVESLFQSLNVEGCPPSEVTQTTLDLGTGCKVASLQPPQACVVFQTNFSAWMGVVPVLYPRAPDWKETCEQACTVFANYNTNNPGMRQTVCFYTEFSQKIPNIRWMTAGETAEHYIVRVWVHR